MTHFRRPALLVLLVAAVAACSAGSESDARPDSASDQSSVDGTDQSSDQSTVDGSDPTSEDGAPDTESPVGDGTPLTLGSGPITLTDPTEGLDGLPSFQQTLTITFDGTRDGVAEQWTQSEVSVVGRDPSVAQFTSERTGSGAFTIRHVAVGGVDYDVDTEGTCVAKSSPAPAGPDTEVDPFAPRRQAAELLPGFVGADEAGSESVGGTDTSHYTFVESALGLASPVTATGDVWVATSGGHVVRYSLVIDGASPYISQPATGRLTLDYELLLLAVEPIVVVPEGCPAGLIDAPLPADAADIVSRPGLLTYVTAGVPAEVQALYEGELPAAGWVAATAPLVDVDSALLTYDRGSQRLVISISNDGVTTTVVVLLTG